MRILVLGATGGTGRCIVQQALEQGFEVTAFARRPLGSASERLRALQGDVLDPAQLEVAVAGQRAVLWAIGAKPWSRAARHLCSDGTHNLVRTMQAAKVERLVCESALGVGDSRTAGLYARMLRLILRARVRDKERQEEIIRSSGLEWTIVRPTILTNGPRTGHYRVGKDLQVGLFPRISRADVADFMLKALGDDSYIRKAVGITY